MEFGNDALFVTQNEYVYFYGASSSLLPGTYSGNPKLYSQGKTNAGNLISIVFYKQKVDYFISTAQSLNTSFLYDEPILFIAASN